MQKQVKQFCNNPSDIIWRKTQQGHHGTKFERSHFDYRQTKSLGLRVSLKTAGQSDELKLIITNTHMVTQGVKQP